MSLEVIEIPEVDQEFLCCEEDSDNFEFIKIKLYDTDREKGIYYNTMTIKRKSDGKTFVGEVTEWGQGNTDFESFEEVEVKPKKVKDKVQDAIDLLTKAGYTITKN